MRSGILAAGNWIRDHVMVVDSWPAEDGLANILSQSEANGGGPYNVLKDLSRLGAPFPLAGLGIVGDDAKGRAILAECRELGVDAARLRVDPDSSTSFTEVITVRGTGRRTFFHHRGANAQLGPGDFDFTGAGQRLFYLGYLFLLDGLDAAGPDGAPAARDVLRRARSAGLQTSLDCVSAATDPSWEAARAVLPEVDVLFANEYEAGGLSGHPLALGGAVDRGAIETVARALVGHGVRRWAVVHFPAGACACSGAGDLVWQPAVRVRPELIAGSVGAGDALSAGVLFGVHEGWPIERSLELGVCAAAASLLHPTCSEGVLSHGDCIAFGQSQGFASFS
jgi:sugar/nucleoside kinase (ribokinase family)